MAQTQTVITYQHAYLSGRTITLCATHAVSGHPVVERIFGSIGPVSRGAHRDRCTACEVVLDAGCPDCGGVCYCSR